VLICCSLVASVVAVLVRYRGSRGVERLQLKWVMLAGALLVVVLPISAALWTAWPPIQYAPALALPLLPLAVCVAIVRQHLYDIDLVISRTVAYGAGRRGVRVLARGRRDRGARGGGGILADPDPDPGRGRPSLPAGAARVPPGDG